MAGDIFGCQNGAEDGAKQSTRHRMVPTVVQNLAHRGRAVVRTGCRVHEAWVSSCAIAHVTNPGSRPHLLP
jgi:hypothetical protein